MLLHNLLAPQHEYPTLVVIPSLPRKLSRFCLLLRELDCFTEALPLSIPSPFLRCIR